MPRTSPTGTPLCLFIGVQAVRQASSRRSPLALNETNRGHNVAEESLEFKEGDAIVHPTHGAGRVIAIEMWEVAGVERQYYSIELINDHGMLMIPVEQADEAGLRHAISDPGTIYAVLNEEPHELDSDHRKRQARVSDQIRSGEALEITEALRDLAWRERTDSLTERDQKLKSEAEDLIIGELALQPDLNRESAAEELHKHVTDAMDAHRPDGDDEHES
jgi:CarD family transcriptional regulator